MADDDSADAAVKELNGAVIDGQEVKVDRARGGGGGGRGGKYQFCCLLFPGNFTFVLDIYYAFSTKAFSKLYSLLVFKIQSEKSSIV